MLMDQVNYVATTGLESIPSLHIEEAQKHWRIGTDWESVSSLSESIRKSVKPVLNTWFPPSYRRKMVKVLTRRACKGILEDQS